MYENQFLLIATRKKDSIKSCSRSESSEIFNRSNDLLRNTPNANPTTYVHLYENYQACICLYKQIIG